MMIIPPEITTTTIKLDIFSKLTPYFFSALDKKKHELEN